ncbi:MAG: UDP-N-acetylglucosamine 1-carboxyvinyltransferase, partial [Planctomycetota bacterium]
MDIFHIEGPVQLRGTVTVNGSKNASLPIMAAAILAPGKSVLKSLPELSDISVCSQLLGQLGCRVERGPNGDVSIDSTVIDNPVGEYDIVRRMRAS